MPQNQTAAELRLHTFITEGMEAAKEKQEHFSRCFPDIPPPWPAWGTRDGRIVAEAWAEVGSPEQSIRDILWRLKKFHYPYDLGPKNSKTFYQHAKSLNLLNSLTCHPLLTEIRLFWHTQRYDIGLARLRNQSQEGYPLKFHHKFMLKLSAHLHEIQELAQSNGVPGDWFKDYRTALISQLVREAAIYFPDLEFLRIPATRVPTRLERIDAQVRLFGIINSALQKRDIQNKKFAYHLTALLCTPREHIRRHNELLPTPVTVRRNIESQPNR